MALFRAELGFNINEIDLWSLNAFADAVDFYDNAYVRLDGTTYTDLLDVYWFDYSWNTYFGGSNIQYNRFTGSVTGGTVTGIFEDFYYAGSYVPTWSLQGASISAVALWNASLTSSVQDDLAIIRQALAGADRFELSGFADVVRGYGGADRILGYGGGDRLFGGDGGDQLWGGNGSDNLYGEAGNDALNGGAGADRLTGGGGYDDFVYSSTSHSAPASTTRDVISGFAKGQDDIVVSAIDAKAGLSGNQAFVLDTNGSFSAGEIRQRVTSSGLLLEFNTDGDATVEMAILLQGLTSRLAGTDFVF